MQPPDNCGVDSTGVRPDDFPIAPLDGRTFVERLQRLSERARDLTLLRRARAEQHTRRDALMLRHRNVEAPRTIPHSFGFRAGVDVDKLNQLADELEAEAAAESLKRIR